MATPDATAPGVAMPGSRPSFMEEEQVMTAPSLAAPIIERIYRPGTLSIGLVLPVRQGGKAIDFGEQIALAELADELGFAAVWVRDVPLNGPWYPETIGHLDPWVALGAIAARTRHIGIGTAAAVLPLRHPLHVAKAAASLQTVSGGRLLLGLGSGDRPEEYAAFGRSFGDRRARHQDAWERVAQALRMPNDIEVDGATYEMRPANPSPPPLIAIGGGGQTLEWVARNASGWATYHREPATQRDRHALWRNAVDRVAPGKFRSFSVAVHIELNESAKEPIPIKLGYRTSAMGMATIISEQRQIGVHHLMLNLTAIGLSPTKALQDITRNY